VSVEEDPGWTFFLAQEAKKTAKRRKKAANLLFISISIWAIERLVRIKNCVRKFHSFTTKFRSLQVNGFEGFLFLVDELSKLLEEE
jgi:hypothetical protein